MLLFALNANRNVAYQRDIEKKQPKGSTEGLQLNVARATHNVDLLEYERGVLEL
jgi:hypothetical protein